MSTSQRLRAEWFKQRELLANAELRRAWRAYRRYARRAGCRRRPLILGGMPKCGNTWVRFFYHHLVSVATGAEESLTYTRLNEIQRNIEFPYLLRRGLFREPHQFSYGRWPLMFHSHHPWETSWQAFGDLLFVYRNPLDSLVSLWYNDVEFNIARRGTVSIDEYAIAYTGHWHTVVSRGIEHAKSVLCYEEMLADPLRSFGAALRALELPVRPSDLERAVELSSFNAVRRMEDESGQHHGHNVYNENFHLVPPETWAKESNVRFTRSGKVGQWKKELSSRTVDFVFEYLSSQGMPPERFILE